VVDAKIFFPIRNWFAKTFEPRPGLDFSFIEWVSKCLEWILFYVRSFIGKLLSCGYCFSVWTAAPFAFIAPGDITSILWVDLIIKWMVLHRMSNMLHEGFSRWLKRAPWVLVFQKVDVLNEPNQTIEVLDEPTKEK
jgi:hypothetical protein